ncbi:MAG: DUF3429 domain-containing protein [Burkholderiaceae bacterium]|nr:DUF3429 domain-containing protein [Burkholderiaceae bacterium]
MSAPRRPSPVAWALGLAGLIPFVVGAAAMRWPALLPWPVPGGAPVALAAYGAVIVSFLGGIHWGLAMSGAGGPSLARLAWGVVPSLLAWPALLLPPAWSLAVLAAALVLCFMVDRRSYAAIGLAGWLPLRGVLTAVAALSCTAGAALT